MSAVGGVKGSEPNNLSNDPLAFRCVSSTVLLVHKLVFAPSADMGKGLLERD